MNTSSQNAVLLQRSEGILTLILNRPERRNAITQSMAEDLARFFRELDSDPELRAGIVCGSSEFFSAGGDLVEMATSGTRAREGGGLVAALRNPPKKPLIAAVEGFALAGGFELVLSCDLIVAGETALFGLPECKRGIVAAAGGLTRLSRRIPRSVAMEIALTGAPIGVERAHQLGLVNQIVPAGEARNAALKLAATIAHNAPLAVTASKELIIDSRLWPEDALFQGQQPVIQRVFSSRDAAEGPRAFAEKRQPVWSGS